MEEESAAKKLRALRATRGYTKASLTRLHTLVTTTKDNLTSSSPQYLKELKERARTCFEQYEGVNIAILELDSEDAENVAEYESKYFVILEALSQMTVTPSNTSPTQLHPTRTPTRLPPIDIPHFTGKCTEYTTFISLFTSLISNNDALDDVQKLYYLRSYLTGEPLDIVKNLPLLADSYTKALSLLEERYNNTYKIINDHICNLLDMKPLFKSSPISLREFVSNIRQQLAALSNMDSDVKYWDAVLHCIICRKLDTFTARAYQLERDADMKPTLTDLLGYLDKRALALENADQGSPSSYPGTSGQHRQSAPGKMVGHLATEMPQCIYCKCNHRLYTCKAFQLLNAIDRVKFVAKNNLCKICLGGHTGQCRYHFRCSECKQSHNTLLHSNNKPPAQHSTATPVAQAPITASPATSSEAAASPAALATGKGCNNDVLLPTAKVKVIARDGTEVHLKALLDSGSQLSFVTAKAVQLLGMTPTQTNTSIVGITNARSNVKYCLPIEVHSLVNPFKTTTTCHVVDQITCQLPQNKLDLSSFALPPNIKLADSEFNIPSEIHLLMGADVVFQTLLPSELPPPPPPRSPQPPSAAAQPSVINTQFGHVIGGSIPQHTNAKKKTEETRLKEEESIKYAQVLPEELYKKVCLTLDLPYKKTIKTDEKKAFQEKQEKRILKEPLLSFRKKLHIDREMDSDTEVEISPRESEEQVNVHLELLSKPEREQVTWATRYLQPEKEEEKSLVRKADDLTDRIAQEFCEYMKQLGGDQQSQLFKPNAIKELFQIEFDTHVARSLQVVPKELPSVEDKIAEITGNPQLSRYAVLEREVSKDIVAENLPDNLRAFGRSLPRQDQRRAPRNNTKTLWRSARHVPKDLVSLKTVWEGITNLRSVKEYCRWMIEHPEFRRAPYLSSLGMFDPAVLEARLTFESLHASPAAPPPNIPEPIEKIRRRLSQLADSN